MKNNWYYNNPYIYLIIKENDEQLPVFICKGQMIIPIFLDYIKAETFNNKFLGDSTKIIAVDMLNGIKAIEKILMNNNYIPQVGIYDNTLSVVDSKEFVEDFYKYKESYNTILNQVLSKSSKIDNDTLIALLMYSPVYVVTSSISDNSAYYKVIQDANGTLLGIQHVITKEGELFTDYNKNILIFTEKKLFEEYKIKSNCNNIGIKKYWDIFDVLDDIDKNNRSTSAIMINPNTLNRTLFVAEIVDYSKFKKQNILN